MIVLSKYPDDLEMSRVVSGHICRLGGFGVSFLFLGRVGSPSASTTGSQHSRGRAQPLWSRSLTSSCTQACLHLEACLEGSWSSCHGRWGHSYSSCDWCVFIPVTCVWSASSYADRARSIVVISFFSFSFSTVHFQEQLTLFYLTYGARGKLFFSSHQN